MSSTLISIFLIVFCIQSALSQLVDRSEKDGFQVIPIGVNKYNLRIRHTDGSVLDELVEKSGRGSLQVTGRLNQASFRPAGNLVVTYQQPQGQYMVLPEERQKIVQYTTQQEQKLPQIPQIQQIQQVPKISTYPQFADPFVVYQQEQPQIIGLTGGQTPFFLPQLRTNENLKDNNNANNLNDQNQQNQNDMTALNDHSNDVNNDAIDLTSQ